MHAFVQVCLEGSFQINVVFVSLVAFGIGPSEDTRLEASIRTHPSLNTFSYIYYNIQQPNKFCIVYFSK